MRTDDEPTSQDLREHRSIYRRQRYDGDLGAVIQPCRAGGLWRSLGVAAILAVCALLGWRSAVALRPAPPVSQLRPAIDPSPPLHTLELPAPPEAARAHRDVEPAGERRPERRPVLPGVLAMSRPRAAPPPRPESIPRVPAMSLLILSRDRESTAVHAPHQGPIP